MIFYNIGRCINIFVNFTATYKGLNKMTLLIKRNNQNN